MNGQPELLENPEQPLPKDRLFVGILPDQETAGRIHEIAAGIRHHHGLTAPIRPVDHFHITLRWIDDYPKLSEFDVEQASAACESAAAKVTPFEVCLDRVLSWGHNVERKPLVMIGGVDSNDPLLSCHQVLLKELVKSRCQGRGSRILNPHLTLLYDKSKIPQEQVSPLCWKVTELVLIHSKLGTTTYLERGRWKLRG
jgi:2'-5' RNA ligase